MFDKIIETIKRFDVIKIGVAGTVLLCLNWIVFSLVSHEIPTNNKEILIHTLGLIEGVVISVANFYWGSSHGSKEKTEQMAKLLKKE